MSIQVDAVNENGVLKLDHPVVLEEHQRVRVVIQQHPTIARQMYGHVGWAGDPETVRRIANDPQFGVQRSQ